jgi:peptide chain release factor subunit 3
VQIKLLHLDEDMISSGNVLSVREIPMPSSLIFEAELELLELLEYKPILSKGYTCMIHIHTFSDEVVVKDILWALEKDAKTGE